MRRLSSRLTSRPRHSRLYESSVNFSKIINRIEATEIYTPLLSEQIEIAVDTVLDSLWGSFEVNYPEFYDAGIKAVQALVRQAKAIDKNNSKAVREAWVDFMSRARGVKDINDLDWGKASDIEFHGKRLVRAYTDVAADIEELKAKAMFHYKKFVKLLQKLGEQPPEALAVIDNLKTIATGTPERGADKFVKGISEVYDLVEKAIKAVEAAINAVNNR